MGFVWLSLGCSSDDASDAFVGRWLATHYANSDTCNGDTNSDDGEANFAEMELRAVGADTIEYVTFFDDGVTVGCTQKFQVRGSVASILPDQTCSFGDVLQEFPEDRLTLTGDSLREEGKWRIDYGDGLVCEQTFEVDMTRVR